MLQTGSNDSLVDNTMKCYGATPANLNFYWGAEGAPILFSEIGFCMASCSYIRQHGSAVYVGMVVVVCIP